jgi:hypothetical protein
VDAALSDARFSAYVSHAKTVSDRINVILNDHEESWCDETMPLKTGDWCDSRTLAIPGSFYYLRDWEPGIWSKPTAFNHNATFYTAALLRAKHVSNAKFVQRADQVVRFFKKFVIKEGGAYFWYYDPGTAAPKPEDIGHGQIDVGFLLLAYKRGITSINKDDMIYLKETFKRKLYKSPGDVFDLLNSTGVANQEAKESVGYDWIDLAEFDPEVLNMVISIYKTHEKIPSGRGYLGWANILTWKAK